MPHIVYISAATDSNIFDKIIPVIVGVILTGLFSFFLFWIKNYFDEKQKTLDEKRKIISDLYWINILRKQLLHTYWEFKIGIYFYEEKYLLTSDTYDRDQGERLKNELTKIIVEIAYSNKNLFEKLWLVSIFFAKDKWIIESIHEQRSTYWITINRPTDSWSVEKLEEYKVTSTQALQDLIINEHTNKLENLIKKLEIIINK